MALLTTHSIIAAELTEHSVQFLPDTCTSMSVWFFSFVHCDLIITKIYNWKTSIRCRANLFSLPRNWYGISNYGDVIYQTHHPADCRGYFLPGRTNEFQAGAKLTVVILGTKTALCLRSQTAMSTGSCWNCQMQSAIAVWEPATITQLD